MCYPACSVCPFINSGDDDFSASQPVLLSSARCALAKHLLNPCRRRCTFVPNLLPVLTPQMYQSSLHLMPQSQFYDLSPFRYCKPELVQRISSWRMNIQHTTDSNNASGSVPNPTRTRNRLQKPYTRPEQRSSARNSFSPDIYVSDGLERSTSRHPVEMPMQPTGSDGIWGGQVHYVAKPRRSNDLPDPERNPLVTNCQADLEEEYSRVVRLYEILQEKKSQLEHLHIHQPSITVMQQLMDVGASIQRLVTSAHYIVSYSASFGFDINFAALLCREQKQQPTLQHEPLDMTIKMPQPRAFSEGWKVNPL